MRKLFCIVWALTSICCFLIFFYIEYHADGLKHPLVLFDIVLLLILALFLSYAIWQARPRMIH